MKPVMIYLIFQFLLIPTITTRIDFETWFQDEKQRCANQCESDDLDGPAPSIHCLHKCIHSECYNQVLAMDESIKPDKDMRNEYKGCIVKYLNDAGHHVTGFSYMTRAERGNIKHEALRQKEMQRLNKKRAPTTERMPTGFA